MTVGLAPKLNRLAAWISDLRLAIALLVGTAILMSSIVFSLQRYFEYQIREAQTLSQ